MEDDGPDLVPAGEVHSWDGADALTVENDVLRGDAEPGAQGVPGGLDVSVQILLGGFPLGHAVAAVVVAEDVAVDPGTEAEVEGAHLPEVHGIAV